MKKFLLITSILIGLRNYGIAQQCDVKVHTTISGQFELAVFDDFNNDGKIDYISAAGMGLVGSLGDASGSNLNFNGYLSLANLPAIALKLLKNDFNNDGISDLAVAVSNSVIIYLNNTNFSFTPVYTSTLSSTNNAINILSGDINNDGNNDVVMITQNNPSTNYKVLIGGGNGNFTSSVTYSLNNGGFYSSLEDFNNDNNLDLITVVASGNGPNQVCINYGTSSCTFGVGPTFSYGLNFVFQDLTVGDFNNDGKKDYAVVASNTNTNNVIIKYGNGSGGFPTSVTLPDNEISRVCFKDLNNDNLKDLIYTSFNNKEVCIRMRLNNGSYSTPQYLLGGNKPSGLWIFDINNNNLNDIFISNTGSSLGTLILNNGSNDYLAIKNTRAPAQYLTSLHSYDINNNGTNDIIGLDGIGIRVLKYTSQNNFSLSSTFQDPTLNGGQMKSADFNNDGFTDLTVANGNILKFFFNNAVGIYTSSLSINPCNNILGMDIADFNNDGNKDVVAVGQGGDVAICIGNGSGTFAISSFTLPGSNHSVVCYDFNQDGNSDIVIGSYGLKILLGNGNGSFQPYSTHQLPFNTNYYCTKLLVDDYNLDGKMDLVIGRSSFNSAISISLGTNTGTFITNNTATYNFYSTTALQTMCLKDINGDNKRDIIFFTDGLKVLLNNNAPLFSYNIEVGENVNTIINAEINNDGNEDLCFSNISGNGSLSLMLSNNNFNSTQLSNLNICSGNTASLNVFSAGPISWFSSPTSTVPIATGMQFITPALTATASPLTYTYYAENTGCVSTYPRIAITVTVENCVWPGDANYDLIVNNLDLFSIGINFGQAGNARSVPTNSWTGQKCINWPTWQNSGINMKHVDCDGNGTINLSDTLAINNNFNQTHPAKNFLSTATCSNTNIYFTFNKSLFFPGDTVICTVNLGRATAIQNVCYGISFELQFDTSVLKLNTSKVISISSWLGIPLAERITFNRVNQMQGNIISSQCRLNQQSKTGFGPIMSYRFILKDTLVKSHMLLSIVNASKIDSTGNLTNLITCSDSIQLSQGIIGMDERSSSLRNIKIIPNPSFGIFKIQSNSEFIYSYTLFDLSGKELISTSSISNGELDLTTFKGGIYILKVCDSQNIPHHIKLIKY